MLTLLPCIRVLVVTLLSEDPALLQNRIQCLMSSSYERHLLCHKLCALILPVLIIMAGWTVTIHSAAIGSRLRKEWSRSIRRFLAALYEARRSARTRASLHATPPRSAYQPSLLSSVSFLMAALTPDPQENLHGKRSCSNPLPRKTWVIPRCHAARVLASTACAPHHPRG